MKETQTIKTYKIPIKEFMDVFKLKGKLMSINNYYDVGIEVRIVVDDEKEGL